MGVDKLEVEGKALTFIKKSRSIAIDKSEISAYIRDIHHNQRGFQSIHFKHVQRSANIIAHKLASESLRRNEEIYLEVVMVILEKTNREPRRTVTDNKGLMSFLEKLEMGDRAFSDLN
ncbi:hypothetical protein Golob_017047 [Gossypium lobatum]|uniref:RNase H type-1 domain-containing protein n=1 Tax=Gossypium lobatum TaxID=34289 RepID=A0A7J8M5Y4_9ROSI|nr:hypothetical protein [Gossypium lobatum]